MTFKMEVNIMDFYNIDEPHRITACIFYELPANIDTLHDSNNLPLNRLMCKSKKGKTDCAMFAVSVAATQHKNTMTRNAHCSV